MITHDSCGYLVIFTVSVLETALPFFGVTVTVSLHDPALRPLSAEPDETSNDTFDVEGTTSLPNAAIDFALAEFDTFTDRAETVVTVVDARTLIFRLGFGAEK